MNSPQCLSQVILKIPNRFGKVLTWVLTIFMVFDCAMSLLAVDRWSERVRGETPRLRRGCVF